MNSLNLSSFSMTDENGQAYQYSFPGEESLYKDYKPVTRNLIPLPKAVLYLLMGALVVVAVAYVIVGHLIKDIVSDVVDSVLGPNEDDMEKQNDLRGINLSHISTELSLTHSNIFHVWDQDDEVIPRPSGDSHQPPTADPSLLTPSNSLGLPSSPGLTAFIVHEV
ncbi:hypothetical protein P4O66_007499 [Electrophorus voltai]|uniref:Uncharacterized protein n=1 Tax=Electrophorus voltai TaxID=2609070 RepID=A0AAD8ZIV7_9TELE|nr:hypothetical protein P4O66_007499 [Electrophorus voltai]